jgi:hypothetical protein
MTISEQKPFEEILALLEGEEKIFLLGCTDCATVVQVGGEEQLKEMKEKLEAKGKQVTGLLLGEPGCHQLQLKRQLRQHGAEVESAEAILVLSCGTGAQTAAAVSEKPVHSGTNTKFLGTVKHFGVFDEFCSACGECLLEKWGNICAITRCSKGLVNGPCGGTSAEGKCEVSPEIDCAWMLIYKKLSEAGQLDKLRETIPAKTWQTHPGHVEVKKKEAAAA